MFEIVGNETWRERAGGHRLIVKHELKPLKIMEMFTYSYFPKTQILKNNLPYSFCVPFITGIIKIILIIREMEFSYDCVKALANSACYSS